VIDNIHWLGHASFRIDNDLVIYIDPWRLHSAVPPADLVLVTHGHSDHLSPDDLARIAKPDTVYVCARPYAASIKGDVRPISVGASLEVRGVKIEAVASYNTNKPNHPKSAGNVGYVLTVGGQRIYHAGDTDVIPEMAAIRCDVALLPVGGTYTMDAKEAAEAARLIGPRVVVPMHWGAIVGSKRDPETLAARVPDTVQVIVLEVEA
jgi:L-ascorbate metabolism protein UlaG (beta-lactamase superfamily)